MSGVCGNIVAAVLSLREHLESKQRSIGTHDQRHNRDQTARTAKGKHLDGIHCGIDHESRVLRDRPSPLTLPSLLRSLSPRSVFATVPKLNPCSDKTADCAASASPAFGARRECRNGDRGSRRIAARKNLHETVRNDAGKCGKTRRYPHTPRACARLTGPGGVAAPPSVAERRRIRPKDCHPRIGALYTAISEPQW